MDHPDTRQLARYAMAEIRDEAELTALEDHLMECAECQRRALAIDMIGSLDEQASEQQLLHIATDSSGEPVALCGDSSSRNLISPVLLPGLDATALCPACVAVHNGVAGHHVN